MSKIDKSGNYRSQNHTLLIYPDDPKVSFYFDQISCYDHVYILHDRDKDEKGQVKKAHYHVVIHTRNQTWRNGLSEKIGIPANYIQQVRNFDSVLEYLVHANEENKFQYSLDDLKGCSGLIRRVKKLVELDTMSESDKVSELIEMIMGHEGRLTIREFAWYCSKNNRWDIFRRSGSIFLEIIKEKNKGV